MKLKKPIRLTTAQIFDCVNNSKNYNLRMNYLNDAVMKQIIVDQQEDGLCAMAVFSVRQYESCSYVKIGWNGLIETADCNCPYCAESIKCAHVAALLSWLQENVNALDVPYVRNTERMEESMALWEEVFVSSFELVQLANDIIGTKGKMNLQRSLDWTKLLIARKQNEQISLPVLARGSVHLQLKEATGYYSYYRNDNCKAFELKIGKDRYYVVKSIPELLNRLQNEETYKYGKELEFCHTKEVFDHNSRRLLEFLQWYCRFNSFYDPRHILVSDGVLPMFFDCMADLDESDCTDVTAETRNIAIPLRFEKQQQYGLSYYSCEQEMPEGTYVSGCWYQWEDHTLIRHTADQPKEVLALTEALSMDLQIEESLMPAFMETYVLPCQKDLVVEGIDLHKYRRMENWTFYCDANENHELTILAVSEGAEKNYLFDPQYRIKSFKARQMEAFILQYAYGVDEESYQAVIRERHAMEFCTNQMENLKTFGEVYISDALKRMSIQRKLHMSVGVSLSGNLVNVRVNTDG
ncbi:MAG: SNF2 helicase associated domain-containing protein, partial [Erysipelotrichaceae bacterium]|nr:SNF2 helicase associated domain-containing protein [Erysipelotrichaceae bacterium]